MITAIAGNDQTGHGGQAGAAVGAADAMQVSRPKLTTSRNATMLTVTQMQHARATVGRLSMIPDVGAPPLKPLITVDFQYTRNP